MVFEERERPENLGKKTSRSEGENQQQTDTMALTLGLEPGSRGWKVRSALDHHYATVVLRNPLFPPFAGK